MTAAWMRDGSTRQNLFRGCPHPAVIDGRCSICRARSIETFVQVRSEGGHHASPIGSMKPPNLGAMPQPGPARISKDEYNRSPRRRVA